MRHKEAELVPNLTHAAIVQRHPAPLAEVRQHEYRVCDTALAQSWRDALVKRPEPDSIWVFAYGSLIWKPEIEPDDAVVARVDGLHRRFCLWQWRSRGLPARPGLMLALDGGGRCVGVAHRFVGTNLEERLWPLWRREMRGNGYLARWVNVTTSNKSVKALTFVANRAGPRYARQVSPHRVARIIARANGARGPSAEYLLNTVEALSRLGINDSGLRGLQADVARELAQWE